MSDAFCDVEDREALARRRKFQEEQARKAAMEAKNQKEKAMNVPKTIYVVLVSNGDTTSVYKSFVDRDVAVRDLHREFHVEPAVVAGFEVPGLYRDGDHYYKIVSSKVVSYG